MYCTKCGAPNDDSAAQCGKCGQSFSTPPELMAIPNYLVQAILATVCCCVPFGIVAIVYAAQVNGKIAAKDTAGAMDSSQKAKMWSWIAFGCGAVGYLLYFFVMVLGTLTGSH